MKLRSVQFRRVLDVGVGHVHWCEQYSAVYGGELQPLRSGRPLVADALPDLQRPDPRRRRLHRRHLQLLHDGPAPTTTNPRSRRTYAILYHDEQFYFTQRWRLVHPDDFKGPMFALVKPDPDTPGPAPLPLAKYWCPFRAGQFGPRSRLAVAAQVLLVTGGDPPGGGRRCCSAPTSATRRWTAPGAGGRCRPPVRYFGTPRRGLGRSRSPATRHRLPGDGPPARGHDDPPQGDAGRGRGRALVPALPAGREPRPPPIGEVAAGQRPPRATAPLEVPARARLPARRPLQPPGVYDTVDSRSRYYPVTPASDADAAKLAAAPGGDWLDEGRQLAVDPLHFPWHGGLLGYHPRRPPSIHEPVMRLRIMWRDGRGWIALHRDKRDDDLDPFAGLPPDGDADQRARRASGHHRPRRRDRAPPAVRRAHVWWEGSGDPTGGGRLLSSARRTGGSWSASGGCGWRPWSRRTATRPGRPRRLAPGRGGGGPLRPRAGTYEYRWTPTATGWRRWTAIARAKPRCHQHLVGRGRRRPRRRAGRR